MMIGWEWVGVKWVGWEKHITDYHLFGGVLKVKKNTMIKFISEG